MVGPAVGEGGVALLTERGDAFVDVVTEVEQATEREAVVERFGQRTVAVVAAPHPRLGEEPAAFVITRGGAAVDDAALARFLEAEGVAPQKIPRVVVTVDDLPRTASGKVKKYELVERLPN